MSKAEAVGRRIGEAIHNHPRIARIVVWLIVLAVLAGGINLAWKDIAAGKSYKFFIAVGIAAFAYWRYRSAASGSAANENVETPRVH
jgi:hypothetical protein